MTQAKDGADAIRKLEKDPSITFIISDWEMPLMDGLSFLQRVKFNPSRANLPFLIVTSPISKEAEKVVLAAENLVDGYLIKPFRIHLLKEKIDSALAVSIRGPQKQALVVDDDPDARATVVDYLESMGFKDIQQAQSGKEALTYLAKAGDKVGLIISDWEMPELSGVELLAYCKRVPNLREVPFLIVTSQTSIERMKVMSAAKERVDDYLLKPFGLDEMKRRIETLIERSRTHSEVHDLSLEANDALEHGKYDKAQTMFDEILRINPDSDVALRGMGEALLRLKGAQAALPFFKKAIDSNPVNPKGYQRLAFAYEQVGLVEKGIALLETAIEQISFNADLHFQLGQLLMKRGNEASAIQEFEKTLEIQLDHQEARVMLEMLKSKRSK